MKNDYSYKTIEEVWKWRRKAYKELENLPTYEKIKRIRDVGNKYSEKMHLPRMNKKLVT